MFLILGNESDALNNMHLRVKQRIHAIDKHPTKNAMLCNISVPSVVDNLKNIHLNSKNFNELFTILYNRRNKIF